MIEYKRRIIRIFGLNNGQFKVVITSGTEGIEFLYSGNYFEAITEAKRKIDSLQYDLVA